MALQQLFVGLAVAIIFTSKESEAQLDVCGKAPLNTNTRIVGGQTATTGEWPWQVSVHRGGGHICGGSLINNLWVLSAAHWFQRLGDQFTNTLFSGCSGNASDNTVYLGRQSQEGPNPNEVQRTVVRVINHPDYSPFTNDNDMALLQLNETVTFTDYIVPVCLAAPGSTFYAGTSTWITGWGTIASGVSLPSPQNLMKVQVPVVGNRQCFCNYAPGSIITDNMICAGLQEGGKDSCQGDAGGPMVSKQNGRWIQSGVVSFGIGCALAGKPGVYARVSRYQSWINNLITINQPGFITYTSSGNNSDLNVSCNSLPLCGTVNGSDASPRSWPWQVSITNNGSSYLCGGSLINEQWIVSSAECLYRKSANSLVVYVGSTISNYYYDSTVSRRADLIQCHPSFDYYSNDICLLRLSTPVTFSSNVNPVCLAAQGSTFYTGTSVWVAGWGSYDTYYDLNTTLVGENECSCRRTVLIPDNSICAETGNYTNIVSSGIPLLVKKDSVWVQSGILSSNCYNRQPCFYTDVSKYQDWIIGVVSYDYTLTPGFVSFTSPGMDSDLNYNCTIETYDIFASSGKIYNFNHLLFLCSLTMVMVMM